MSVKREQKEKLLKCPICEIPINTVYDGIHVDFYECYKCERRYYRVKDLDGWDE